jgi:hypothetical protein
MKKKRIEFYIAILAIIVAFFALLVSLWQLEITREHNRLSVRPKILITPYLEGPGGRNGLYIENSGLGPGTIDSFIVDTPHGTYAGFGTNYWKEILESHNLEAFCFSKGWPDPEATLKAGEKIALLEVKKSKPDGCYFEALKTFQQKNIVLSINFHSMYDESFSTKRNFNIGSKELEVINSVIGQYIVK